MAQKPNIPTKDWLAERIAYDTISGCWLWDGLINADGYGKVTIARKSCRAHRVAWEIYNGRITKGADILHKCDVRLCVNPKHLFMGTQQLNGRDMALKQRGRTGCYPYGVCYTFKNKSRPFRALVRFENRSYYAGNFSTVEEAHTAALSLRNKLYQGEV